MFTQDRVIMDKFVQLLMCKEVYQSDKLKILDISLPEVADGYDAVIKKLE